MPEEVVYRSLDGTRQKVFLGPTKRHLNPDGSWMEELPPIVDFKNGWFRTSDPEIIKLMDESLGNADNPKRDPGQIIPKSFRRARPEDELRIALRNLTAALRDPNLAFEQQMKLVAQTDALAQKLKPAEKEAPSKPVERPFPRYADEGAVEVHTGVRDTASRGSRTHKGETAEDFLAVAKAYTGPAGKGGRGDVP